MPSLLPTEGIYMLLINNIIIQYILTKRWNIMRKYADFGAHRKSSCDSDRGLQMR